MSDYLNDACFIFLLADCFDKWPICGYWAVRGDCKRKPGYMKANCCVWCNHIACMYDATVAKKYGKTFVIDRLEGHPSNFGHFLPGTV